MSSSKETYRLTKKKKTRRGFVMTGGGAKGFYEAGVLQAFHLCNMDFDVITGSSIGAINSVAYAEYLLKKLKLDLPPAENIDDILETIGRMENHIYALHSAWLDMPEVEFIDDSEMGPLGEIKNDLIEFDLNLPTLTRLLWWWTTPENKRGPLPLMDLVNLTKELFERVGGSGLIAIINGLRSKDGPLPNIILDTYLEKQGIGTSLVTPQLEMRLRNHFTKGHIPLTEEALENGSSEGDGGVTEVLVPKKRTFKDYHDQHIDVRLTRANFRTGLLEISAYVTEEAFAHTVTRFWRFEKMPEEGFPVTSFRLELPGNPVAIEAALASSRYPVVFSPFPLEKIYPRSDPNNALLYMLIDDDGGFSNTVVQDMLRAEFENNDLALKRLNIALSWLGNENYKSFTGRFFPRKNDIYIDGGAIDNTPSNSAIDAVREDTFLLNEEWRRDTTLDLYAVLLHKLSAQKEADASDPSLFSVVKRTLEINSAAKLTTEANYAETVSGYGNKAEQLAEMLLVLLEAIDELDSKSGSDFKKSELQKQIRKVAEKYDAEKFPKKTQRKGHFKVLMKDEDEILAGVKQKCEDWLDRGLPLDLNIVKIHPDEMPLHTVAFTERLGYERQKGIEMITMGCYNTIWDLRTYLESKPDHMLDDQDKWALELTRKWTGINKIERVKKVDDERDDDDDIAAERMNLRELRNTWKCQRMECIFHRKHCAHGADEDGRFPPNNDKNNPYPAKTSSR